MKQIVFEVVDSPDGGYEAKALGYSIFTQGDSWDDLKLMVQDAVRCHFDEESRPSMIRLLHIRDEVIPI